MCHLLYLIFRCDFDVTESLEERERSEHIEEKARAAYFPGGGMSGCSVGGCLWVLFLP